MEDVVEAVLIARAWSKAFDESRKISFEVARESDLSSSVVVFFEHERDAMPRRSPDAQVNATGNDLGSNRQSSAHGRMKCSVRATRRASRDARRDNRARTRGPERRGMTRSMRRSMSILFVAAVACGPNSSKTTTPATPLPEAKAEPAKPEPKPEPAVATPKEPPAPTGPIEDKVPATQMTYKLLSPGKGKRTQLKLEPKAGAKQQVELAMDFSGSQAAPPELGGTKEDVAPTVVLTGELEVKDVDKDGGAKFEVTINGVDARDKAGAKTTGAEFKGDLQGLNGMTIGGNVGATGQTGDLALRIEKPDAKSEGALGLVKLSLLPMWPLLPTEAIGPGAKWQVTSKSKIADRLDVTQVTEYTLVSHTGSDWVIKGSSKITGADQDVDGAKFNKIGGSGSTDSSITDGALLPTSATQLATDFTANAGTKDQPVALVFQPRPGRDGHAEIASGTASSVRSRPIRSCIARRASSGPTIHA